jgi:hypothetical protein
MGTRSLTHIKDDGKMLVTIYRQMDGYPSGMGADIKKILNNGKSLIVNGYNLDQAAPQYFNGMGCLAAYLVGKLKKGKIGNIYLQPPRPSETEEYTYILSCDKMTNEIKRSEFGKVKIIVKSGGTTIYNGYLEDFNPKEVEESEP